MNAQHVINRRNNRLRRIARKLVELESDKAAEVIRAAISEREPNLSYTLAQINRLQSRSGELAA